MASDQDRTETTERQEESATQRQQTWSTSAAQGERTESAEQREQTPESGGGEQVRLISEETAHDMRTRWDAIQGTFVDNPRNSVNDADSLVSDLLQKVSDTFEQQHHELENQWKQGEPSTEDLRNALHRYRSLFDRLLKV